MTILHLYGIETRSTFFENPETSSNSCECCESLQNEQKEESRSNQDPDDRPESATLHFSNYDFPIVLLN